MDEAGISSREPVAVVAGIIVHADRQWKRIEGELLALGHKHFPGESSFPVFHAKDLFHGSGHFPRDKWPLKIRLEILHSLLSLPRLNNLPLCYGFWRRDHLWQMIKENKLEDPKHPAAVEAMNAQKVSYWGCALGAEVFMRTEASSNEVAIVVAEDNKDVRRYIDAAHRWLRVGQDHADLMPSMKDLLPITKIIGNVHFSLKEDCPLLQMADACAFVLARYMWGGSHSKELYDAMTGGVALPIAEGSAGHSLVTWQSRFGGFIPLVASE